MNLLRKSIRFLLQAEGDPRQLALAFAVGVFFGFSPLLGLHTVLGLAAAVAFRLNKVAVLAGVYSNNPWIIVPFYGFSTWLGARITGLPYSAPPPDLSLLQFFEADFWNWLFSQWRLLIPAAVGSAILCTLLAVASYPLALWAIRKFKPDRRPPAAGGEMAES